MKVELTLPEIRMLLALIADNRSEGSYYSNRVHWENRADAIEEKLVQAGMKATAKEPRA